MNLLEKIKRERKCAAHAHAGNCSCVALTSTIHGGRCARGICTSMCITKIKNIFIFPGSHALRGNERCRVDKRSASTTKIGGCVSLIRPTSAIKHNNFLWKTNHILHKKVKQVANPSDTGQSLAVTAEALYLTNLLLLPGIAFIMLWILYNKHSHSDLLLARCHIKQTFSTSLWAGFLIVIVNAVILLFGGYTQVWTWMVLIIYFTAIHSTLVLLGVLGLARALAGKHFHYPLSRAQCHVA